MKVLVVGATGTIGRAVVAALEPRHEVIEVAHAAGPLRVDISDPASIEQMYRAVGKVNAVVSAAGQAAFGALTNLTDADFALSLGNKLLGQVNLVRRGLDYVTDPGSFTLTSGALARFPAPETSALSLVNGALEAFVRSAAFDLPRSLRINVVSPGWVTETLAKLGMDPRQGTPAAVVAQSYVQCVEGDFTGRVVAIPA